MHQMTMLTSWSHHKYTVKLFASENFLISLISVPSFNWLTYSSDKVTDVAISLLDKKGSGICWHIKWFVNSVSLINKTVPETFRAWHWREPTMGRVCWVLNHLSVNPPLPSSPLQVCSPKIFIETASKWRNNLKGQSWNPPFKDPQANSNQLSPTKCQGSFAKSRY